MATEIIMPKMGQTMEEGTIVEWLVQEGDQVQKGDTVFRFESDKATLEAEAPASGTLLKILYGPNKIVPILEVVGVIGQPGEEIRAQTPETHEKVEFASEKQGDSRPDHLPIDAAGQPAETPAPPSDRIVVSPRARRAARIAGLDLGRIDGSGPGGRIIEADVQAYLVRSPKATPAARRLAQESGIDLATLELPEGAGRLKKIDLEKRPPDTEPAPGISAVIPMAGVRAIISQRMSDSAQTAAAVTLTTEADATALFELREGFKASPLPGDLVPSFNELLVMIAGRALQEHPNMNARLVQDTIERLSAVHVGVAVDTERGLLVPVVRGVEKMKLSEIAHDLRAKIERALVGSSLPDDLSGGTFTVTNLGAYEIDAFTPIINLPECAILGAGRIIEKPAVVNGQICVRRMMSLSLTFDHRINDGAPAARFLQRIKQLVEKPYLLLA